MGDFACYAGFWNMVGWFVLFGVVNHACIVRAGGVVLLGGEDASTCISTAYCSMIVLREITPARC